MKIVMISLMFFLFSGCANIIGVPTPYAKKGEYYLFPEIGVESKVSFQAGVYQNEQEKVYADYARYIYGNLDKSRYFVKVTDQKKPYMMIVEYRIYSHTSFTETFMTLLGSPVAAVFGPDYSLSVDMRVSVKENGKELEFYHYRQEFSAKYKVIQPKAKKYFDIFMDTLLNDMSQRSKLKRIKFTK